MFFWWICGGESGLPVLFLCHLRTASGNSIFLRDSSVHWSREVRWQASPQCWVRFPASFVPPWNICFVVGQSHPHYYGGPETQCRVEDQRESILTQCTATDVSLFFWTLHYSAREEAVLICFSVHGEVKKTGAQPVKFELCSDSANTTGPPWIFNTGDTSPKILIRHMVRGFHILNSI